MVTTSWVFNPVFMKFATKSIGVTLDELDIFSVV